MALILDPVAQGGRKGRVERTRGNSVPKEIILKTQANKGFTCALGHLSNRINTVKETVPTDSNLLT